MNSLLTVSIGAMLLASGAAVLSAQVSSWQAVPLPTLRPFNLAEPRRIALPNGMILLLIEDSDLPLVHGLVRIRGGSQDESADKIGLVKLLAEVWRDGGSTTQGRERLDEFLDSRGVLLEVTGSLDSVTISFDCLASTLEETLTILIDLLRRPAFPEHSIQIAKSKLFGAIARRNDEALEVLFRESRRLGYGRNSPYARVEEFATVAALDRTDLIGWHQQHTHPNNIVLGLVGAFNTGAIERTVRRAFGSWPRGPNAITRRSPIEEPTPGVYLIPKEDVNQSSITMIHLGTTRNKPDFYALTVMNRVLGGGFASRLFSRMRSERGLTYRAEGGVGMNHDYPGLFQLTIGTKSETTAASIDGLFQEIAILHRDGVTPEEFRQAKETVINSFLLLVDSNKWVLNELLTDQFHRYPPHRLHQYRSRVEAVTLADVMRVARQYVRREKIAVLVVGNDRNFERPLETFGPVRRWDITIPSRNTDGL